MSATARSVPSPADLCRACTRVSSWPVLTLAPFDTPGAQAVGPGAAFLAASQVRELPVNLT